MPIDAFISYAHEDSEHLETLRKHLALLRRQGKIRAWHDREITAGDGWRGEIDAALERAELVLLLVSPDFVASDYCWDVELARALERRAAGVRVVPILIRPTDWRSSPLGELQALPRDAEPITTWPDRDQAWVDVVAGLRRLLDELAAGDATSDPAGAAPVPAGHRHRDGSLLVRVPAATYPLGTADLDPASGPPRQVDLDAFWIGQHPVTNAQYRAFREAAGGPEPRYWSDPRFAGDDQPVVGVTWQEADAYCRHAGLMLPPEAWWEAAARGYEGRPYPWGDAAPTPERAVFEGATSAPAAIGGRPAGAAPCGAHDLAGNVREWCAETWDQTPESAATGAFRVVRGGAWNDPAWKLRAAWRTWSAATERSPSVGFRVAAQLLPPE